VSVESSVYKAKSVADLFMLAKSMGLQLSGDVAMSFVKKGYVYLAGLSSSEDWPDAHKWCEEVTGEAGYSWSGHTFAFKDPEHAVMFKLAFG